MTIPYITPAPYNLSPRHSHNPSRHSRVGGNPAASLHHVIPTTSLVMLHNLSRHSRVGGNPTSCLHHVMLHNPSRHSHNPPRHSRVGGNPTPYLSQNVSACGTEPDAVDNSE